MPNHGHHECEPPIQGTRIPLHVPYLDQAEADAAARAVLTGQVGGHGPNLPLVESRLRELFSVKSAIATTSGTHALEIAVRALNLGPTDEVIVPAYGFPTTAACVLQSGARVVFADVGPDSPQIDPRDIERRITKNTKAIIVIHYAGIVCDMPRILQISRAASIPVIEDAAHGFGATFRQRPLGSLGHIGCLSFHATKNITCGEGGAILTSDDSIGPMTEIIRDMGTDRARQIRGEVERYTWHLNGSSYVPSDVLMAVLLIQFKKAPEILKLRRERFSRYAEGLSEAEQKGHLKLPVVPPEAEPNGHIFYIILPSEAHCTKLGIALTSEGISASRHYDSLDTTPLGRTLVDSQSKPPLHSRSVAGRLLRLPIYPSLQAHDQDRVIDRLIAHLKFL